MARISHGLRPYYTEGIPFHTLAANPPQNPAVRSRLWRRQPPPRNSCNNSPITWRLWDCWRWAPQGISRHTSRLTLDRTLTVRKMKISPVFFWLNLAQLLVLSCSSMIFLQPWGWRSILYGFRHGRQRRQYTLFSGICPSLTPFGSASIVSHSVYWAIRQLNGSF